MADTLQRLSTALAGRYTIVRELGAGGMATVYLAEDPRHSRPVAVKVLRAELAAMLGAERFLNEIKVTANLQNPHILPLFDSGEADGMLFYVMPYIQGESLRQRLDREGALPIDDAVRVAREVASALEHAHKHSVVHRDIKPENVLLQDGTALVADFGIAIAVSRAGGSRLTETGLSLGTPWYMSPEQAAGERNIDARSDVYSLGAMTYEMLCGEPPHTGATAQAIVAAVLTEQPRDVRMRRPKVPDHVAAAVHKALERLPGDRFGSAAAFAEALGDPRSASTGSLAVSPAPMALRRATLRGVLAGAAVAGLIVFLAMRGMASRPAAPGGQDRAQHTFTGRALRAALSDDGQFLAFVDRRCRFVDRICHERLLIQEVGSTAPTMLLDEQDQISNVRFTHDASAILGRTALSGAAPGIFTIGRLGGAPRTIASSAPFDTHPSADSIAVAQHDSGGVWIWTMSVAGGRAGDSIRVALEQSPNSMTWSPDARWFALATGDSLIVVGREGRAERRKLLNRGQVRWTADGSALLLFVPGRAREDELMRVPVARGRFRGEPVVVMGRVPTLYMGRFDIARRTGQLALVTGDATSDQWVFDLSGSRITGHQVTRSTTWYGRPTMSADGEWLYYQRGDAIGDNVYRMRLADSTEEALTTDRALGSNPVSLDPAERELVWERHDPATGAGSVAILDLQSRQLRQIPSPTLLWSADLLAVGEGRALLSGEAGVSMLTAGGSLTAVPLFDSSGALGAYVSYHGDSLTFFTIDPAWISLHAAALDGSGERRVTRLPRSRGIDGGRAIWRTDGQIYFGIWETGQPRPALFRVPASGGSPVRIAEFPAPCTPNSITGAARAPRLACQVRSDRSDIWILEGVGR